MNFLVTGGASGLGYAITKALATQYPAGKIYFTYFSSTGNKQQLETDHKNTSGIKCNFIEPGDIDMLVAFIQSNAIDILVNNAVTGLEKQYAHKITAGQVAASFNADVLSVIQITNAFINTARKRKSGKIITILSAAIVNMPATGWAMYIANKNYLLSMHRSWAMENKIFNISSNCISPDFMATPLNAAEDERTVESLVAKHPLKKLLTVEEVAETVLFLCTASQQLNGQNIILNAAQY
jgi:NAD(P)-dependent dehydrogenase (short-subunit alcohol dehydrogenase family)